jgi:hypothetical protein
MDAPCSDTLVIKWSCMTTEERTEGTEYRALNERKVKQSKAR